MWRGVIEEYRRYLPVTDATPVITLHEGGTPLLESPLGRRRGLRLLTKYEATNPTGSFKDRGMTVAVSKAAEAAARGELHAVARLGDTSTARTVRRRAGAHDVTDGPFIETKEWLVGFYLVDCENEEQALARARLISPGDEVAIEVRPVTWRWRP